MTVSAFRLRTAAHHLRMGGLVAYPTEAVFGIGCDPMNETAFAQLMALKGRSVTKGVILIADDPARFERWVAPLAAQVWERMRATWPGAVTWIVPAHFNAPVWVTGGRNTIAIRVPAHQLARRLCTAFDGALVSTSANPSGLSPARTALAVQRYFHGGPLLLLCGDVGGAQRPSTIRNALTGQVLRH